MSDLERLWDDLPVGRAPVDDILRAGRKKTRKPRRRPIRPLLTAGVLTAVGAAFIAGTVVSQPPSDGPGAARPGDGALDASPAAFHGELQPVASCDELLEHYQDEALKIVGPYGWEFGYGPDLDQRVFSFRSGALDSLSSEVASAPVAKSPQTSTSVNSDTGTNVQEAGVDEPDVVKTDGDLLVRIQGATLTTYDVTGEQTERLSQIELEDFGHGEILLSGDTVVALGDDGSRPQRESYEYYAEPTQATKVVSVDIGDPGTPEVTQSVALDTGLVSARQHGSAVRLVTQAGLPELDFVQPTGRKGVKTARQANERVVLETTLADWIPSYSVDGGASEQLADCADMAIPKKELGLDTMNVVGFEADAPAELNAIGLAGSASLAYESPDHLYLAASPWASWGRCFDICPFTFSPDLEESGTTMVFDFEITGTEATYVGSGEVEGAVEDRWAMDEYDGVLRLALGPSQATGNFNSVVTLERRDDELVEIGRVDKLGVNEQIESVRWFDALAIVVTFRQIDPLYAIDLSDQADPTLMGELKIPGFSEYLHPLGARRLVGVGQGPTGERGGWGAQVGLFKVTDLTNPQRIASLSYAPGTQALAGLDPRQFTWLPDERTLLTVISQGWNGRTGYVSVVTLDDGKLTNRMVEADYGNDVAEIRTVPLPDGRVVLVTGDDVEFFDL